MDEDDIPGLPKKEWPDGKERVCAGAIVEYRDAGRHYSRPLVVHETPREVRKLMKKKKPNAMLTLHHQADPNTEVYVRNSSIVSLDVRWELLDEA